jgi:hypothetical protein
MTPKERARQLKDGISDLYKQALATNDPAAWEAQMRLHVELAYCTGRADMSAAAHELMQSQADSDWQDEMERRQWLGTRRAS